MSLYSHTNRSSTLNEKIYETALENDTMYHFISFHYINEDVKAGALNFCLPSHPSGTESNLTLLAHAYNVYLEVRLPHLLQVFFEIPAGLLLVPLVFANILLRLLRKSNFPCMEINQTWHIGQVPCLTSSTGIVGQ